MKFKKKPYLLIILFFVVALPITLWACQVPVFRYSLERWYADNYIIQIINHGQLEEENIKLVESMARQATDEEDMVNFIVQLIDVDNPPEKFKVTEKMKERKAPWMQVIYPYDSRAVRPAWEADLSEENFKKIISSPIRIEIAKRILEGESAVWILLKSGNEEKDKVAETVLRKQLKVMTETLELPEDYEKDSQFNAATEIKMKIVFSLVVLDLKDEKEEFFISSLVNSESEPMPEGEPMAIPIFGRGRTYWALVGKGINESNISDNCKFISGPCGCEVKRDNPGMDLVFQVNWDKRIKGSVIPENTLPDILPAPGIPEGASEGSGAAEDSCAAKNDTATEPEKKNSLPVSSTGEELTWVIVGIFILALLVIGIGVLKIKSQKDE